MSQPRIVFIRRLLRKLFWIFLITFSISFLMCIWDAKILYISFYIFIWGIIPVGLTLVVDLIARKFDYIE